MTMTTWDKNDGITLKARREQNGNLVAIDAKHASIDAAFALLNKTMTVGSGLVGSGGFYTSCVYKVANVIKTEILIDLTGAKSSTIDLDIIGTHATDPSNIGRITDAINGSILAGKMTCLEVPAGGVTDIDVYGATVGTGKFDDPSSGLTGVAALLTSGGAWATGTTKGFPVVPGEDAYLYLMGGAAGTAATYTAGKFLIELWGE